MASKDWNEAERLSDEQHSHCESEARVRLPCRSNSIVESGRCVNSGHGRQGGFTLVEMLVVIAVIAILAALLFPALSLAKAKGKSIVCKNNLRQLGAALLMYEDDWRSYPTDTVFYGPQGQRRDGYNWAAFFGPLQAYLLRGFREWETPVGFRSSYHQRTVFHCPSRGRENIPQSPFGAFIPLQAYEVAYGYNVTGTAGMTNAGRPLGLASIQYHPTNEVGHYMGRTHLRVTSAMIQAPDDMIAIGDVVTLDEWFKFAKANFAEVPWMEKLGMRVADVHRRGANMVFLDGHAEFAKRQKWTEESETARRRWNNDHEPHPETWQTGPTHP